MVAIITSMYEPIFEQLGLSSNEARIYEALIEHGESSVANIAIAAKVHRRNAYDAIERLINKGLCFQIFSSAENKYNAVDPDKLLELVAERREKLEQILPELKKKFGERLAPEEAYIYRGHEGQKNLWRDIVRLGEDSFVVGAKGGWFEPRLETSRKEFFKEANRKKITFHVLFDHEMKLEAPDFPKNYPAALEHHFLPPKYSTNSIINIFGDYVVTYTGLSLFRLEDDQIFFVIHSKDLAESYRKWFWYMWEQSSAE